MDIPEGVVKDEDAFRAGDLLEDLLDLGVVHLLDALVAVELLLRARVLDELEPVLVERELGLASARVVHGHVVRLDPEVVRLLALGRGEHVLVRLLRADRGVVVEGRRDVVGGEDCGGGHCCCVLLG